MMDKGYIRGVVSVIEKSLSGGRKIEVPQIAATFYVSPRQLYRDFYSLTGHSLYKYIYKRRLSKALNLIKYSACSMADIAYMCGYNSQAAMCRAVKDFAGITPTAYKLQPEDYYFPVLDRETFRQIEVKAESFPAMLSMDFADSRLPGIENRAIACLRALFPDYNGRIWGRNKPQQGNRFCYTLFIEHTYDMLLRLQQSAFQNVTICAPDKGSFASTWADSDEESINQAWNYLYGQWLAHSMFEQADAPYFEEYIFQKNRLKKLLLRIPVKERRQSFKIGVQSCDKRLFIVSTKGGRQAEREASACVMDFVSARYPYLLQSQKEYYVSRTPFTCTCGISVATSRYMPEDGSVTMLCAEEGVYVVLEGACYGNCPEYEAILMQWAAENGFRVDGNAFTVYDVSAGMGKQDIVVKVFLKLAGCCNTSAGKQAIIKSNI